MKLTLFSVVLIVAAPVSPMAVAAERVATVARPVAAAARVAGETRSVAAVARVAGEARSVAAVARVAGETQPVAAVTRVATETQPVANVAQSTADGLSSTKDHGIVKVVPDEKLADGRLVLKVVAFNREHAPAAF